MNRQNNSPHHHSFLANFRHAPSFLRALLAILTFCWVSGSAEAQGVSQPPFTNNPVDVVSIQPNGRILIGGMFTTVNGQVRNGIARLNSDGTLDNSLQSSVFISGSVSAFGIQNNGKILVGGSFRTFFNGQEYSNLLRINGDGTLDPTFISTVGGEVRSIIPQSDGKILIGGGFKTVGGQIRINVAGVNSDGSLDNSFVPPALANMGGDGISAVNAIIRQTDGKVVIAGRFNQVSGATHTGIARLNMFGSLDVGFQDANILGANSLADIRGIALQPDGKLLIAGDLVSVGGQPRTGTARIDQDGLLDTTFQDPNIIGTFRTRVLNTIKLQPDGRVLVAGEFDKVSGQSRQKVARLNVDGTLDSNFVDPKVFDGFVLALGLEQDGRIIIGGYFTFVGDLSRYNLALLAADGSPDLGPPRTLMVTKTADTNDGVCDADCSLREAIVAANMSDTADTIEFDNALFSTPQTITLTGGQLSICNAGKLVINGKGADLLTISGNNQSRIFRVFVRETATINNVKMVNGHDGGDSYAGCPSVVGIDASYGGTAVENRGTLDINNSIMSDNTTAGTGGAVSNVYADMIIRNSIIRNNQAASAGGISNIGPGGTSLGQLTLLNSTVSENSAFSVYGNGGGGIGNAGGATITILNSTISRNTTVTRGGGIYNYQSFANIANTTIAMNSADWGGGIYSPIDNESIVGNSIISDNLASSYGPDGFGFLKSQGYNLIRNPSNITLEGDLTGNIVNVDPLLDPILAQNHGLTPTHALRVGSPAIDAGNSINPAIITDQRGFSRPYDLSTVPNASGGNGADIGAFEWQAADAPAITYSVLYGRVVGPDARGLKNAVVALTDSQDVRLSAVTNSFGFFSLGNVTTNGNFILTVTSKRYRFNTRSVYVDRDMTLPDFVGVE